MCPLSGQPCTCSMCNWYIAACGLCAIQLIGQDIMMRTARPMIIHEMPREDKQMWLICKILGHNICMAWKDIYGNRYRLCDRCGIIQVYEKGKWREHNDVISCKLEEE